MMTDPKRHKANGPAQTSVCDDRGLLRLIFSFVGRGEYFFVAEVSHPWQQSYEQLWRTQEKEPRYLYTAKSHLHDEDGVFASAHELLYQRTLLSAPANRTAFKAAFASQSRLEWTWNLGDLNISSSTSQLLLYFGRYSSKQMLKWALLQGMAKNHLICQGAAEAGRLDFLRWLREVIKLPWDLGRVQLAACKRGDLQLLRWVCDAQGGGNSLAESCKLECITAAGASGSMDLLAWLLLNHCLKPTAHNLTDYVYDGAVPAGHIDCARYLESYNLGHWREVRSDSSTLWPRSSCDISS
jgi:hypothetical protein